MLLLLRLKHQRNNAGHHPVSDVYFTHTKFRSCVLESAHYFRQANIS
jgi:hypothetical protein